MQVEHAVHRPGRHLDAGGLHLLDQVAVAEAGVVLAAEHLGDKVQAGQVGRQVVLGRHGQEQLKEVFAGVVGGEGPKPVDQPADGGRLVPVQGGVLGQVHQGAQGLLPGGQAGVKAVFLHEAGLGAVDDAQRLEQGRGRGQVGIHRVEGEHPHPLVGRQLFHPAEDAVVERSDNDLAGQARAFHFFQDALGKSVLVGGGVGPQRGLEFHLDGVHIAAGFQRLGKGGDLFAGVEGAFPAAKVEGAQLVQGTPGDHLVGVGVQVGDVFVVDHQLVVRREQGVELDAVHPHGGGQPEGGHRVFGREMGRAAVCNDLGPHSKFSCCLTFGLPV